MPAKPHAHYVIDLAMPLPGPEWLRLADEFEQYINSKGYDFWEFNTKEIDRDLIVRHMEVSGFEGLIRIDKGFSEQSVRKEISQFLEGHGHTAAAIRFDL